MSPDDSATLAQLLALLVHDLRNPVSTIGANLSYVNEAASRSLDPDVRAALSDSTSALDGLIAGLDNLSYLARWVGGEPAAAAAEGDIAGALRSLAARKRAFDVALSLPEGELRARGAQALPRLVEILLANAAQHAGGKPITLRGLRAGSELLIEVQDAGRAIAPELRELAFTARGQSLLKTRSDGRYGRSLGLFAAGLLAEAMGARLEAEGRDGAAILRVRMTAS